MNIKYLACLTSLLLVGCSSKDSEDVDLNSVQFHNGTNQLLIEQSLRNVSGDVEISTHIAGELLVSEKEGGYIKLTGSDKLMLKTPSNSLAFKNIPAHGGVLPTPEQCCEISARLNHDISQNNDYTAELYRGNELVTQHSINFPKPVEFIYPKTLEELEAITLETDSIDISWHPENESNLAAIIVELWSNDDENCSELPKFSWRNPDIKESDIGARSAGLLEFDDTAPLISKLEQVLTISTEPLQACDKPWSISIGYYYNGAVSQYMYFQTEQ